MTEYHKFNNHGFIGHTAMNEDGFFINVCTDSDTGVVVLAIGTNRDLCDEVKGSNQPSTQEQFDEALEAAVAKVTNSLEAVNL